MKPHLKTSGNPKDFPASIGVGSSPSAPAFDPSPVLNLLTVSFRVRMTELSGRVGPWYWACNLVDLRSDRASGAGAAVTGTVLRGLSAFEVEGYMDTLDNVIRRKREARTVAMRNALGNTLSLARTRDQLGSRRARSTRAGGGGNSPRSRAVAAAKSKRKDDVSKLHQKLCLSLSKVSRGQAVLEGMGLLQLFNFDVVNVRIDISSAREKEPVHTYFTVVSPHLHWSPALQRYVFNAIESSDFISRVAALWRERFFKDLRSRSPQGEGRDTHQMLEQLWNSLVLTGRSASFFAKCEDLQVNCHFVESPNQIVSGAVATVPTHSATNSLDAKSAAQLTSFTEPTTPLSLRPFSCCARGRAPRSVDVRAGLLSCQQSLSTCCLTWTISSLHSRDVALPPHPLQSSLLQASCLVGPGEIQLCVDSFTNVIKTNVLGVESTPLPRPKPKGAQLVLSAKDTLLRVSAENTGSGPNTPSVKLTFMGSMSLVEGHTAPTGLRGLLWLTPGNYAPAPSGPLSSRYDLILRSVLNIQRVAGKSVVELFPTGNTNVKLHSPTVSLSADEDAFHLVLDTVTKCLLYRGQGDREPPERVPAPDSSVQLPPIAQLKAGLIEVLESEPLDAVADDFTTQTKGLNEDLTPRGEGHNRNSVTAQKLSFNSKRKNITLVIEYILDELSVNLVQRQRPFVKLTLVGMHGTHVFTPKHDQRPMLFSFELTDLRVVVDKKNVRPIFFPVL